MSLFRIVLKNLAQRRLSSALTALSIALGVAVTVGVLALKEQGQAAFNQGAFGYDLVVGPRGSKLEIVLSTVFLLDQPPGNVPWSVYEGLKRNPAVRFAVPVVIGDFYAGHRLVGASDKLLSDIEVQPGRKFELADGRIFRYDEAAAARMMGGAEAEPDAFEAVIGSRAASATGLHVGSTFVAKHGGDSGDPHDEKWTVVGVLRPTGTPSDRAIYINLDSFFHIKTHRESESGRGRISAIFVKTRGGLAPQQLQYDFMNSADATAAIPAEEVVKLFDMIGQVDVLLLAVSVLVVVVAGVSILVSLYNSMADRKRPIAIMRALGARRTTIFAVIVMESVALCLAGGVLGLAGGHVLTAVAGGILRSSAGIDISPWAPSASEGWVAAGLLALGIVVGLLPAAKAYRTDIADGLNPTS